jgi:hypothetical protein
MHPSSLIILVFWTISILFMIASLEISVRAENSPWSGWIKTSQMVTIFAQGHTAVTSIHLGRLAISSLHDPVLAPKTWAELFWTADHNWQGPVGIAQTAWGILRLRRKISFTFLLFAATSLVAFFAPTALDRAYSRDLDKRQYSLPTQVRVMSRGTMDVAIVGPQLAVGLSSWVSGESAHVMFMNQLSYESSTSYAQFITASIDHQHAETARLLGILENGYCYELTADPIGQGSLNPPEPPSSNNDMSAWCTKHGLNAQYEKHEINLEDSTALSVAWCTGFNATLTKDWMNHPDGYTTTVVAWVNATRGLNSTQSYINCTSTTQVGNATIEQQSPTSPRSKSKDFQFSSLLHENVTLDQTPFLPPLYAAFVGLTQQFAPSTDTTVSGIRSASLMRMLGYGENVIGTSDRDTAYMAPLLDQVASHLEDGRMHMAVAIQNVGARTFVPIRILQSDLAAIPGAFTRSLPWAIVTYVLLVVWLALLIYGTMRMYGPTFGNSLDSYAAARLLADMPHLVEGYCAGAPSGNPKLRTTFERVGDENPSEDVGHITSGGKGQLEKDRGYGARKIRG